jgi:hypothetical protein
METPVPSPSPAKFPTFTRFKTRLFSWRMLRRYLVALAALVTLAAILYTEEGWRGKRAWQNYEEKLAARGV